MSPRRVAVTGLGVVSPVGCSADEVVRSLREGWHGIRAMPEWSEIPDLLTRVAGTVPAPERFARPGTEARVALFAIEASRQAIEQARLGTDVLSGGRCGVAYGSTTSSSSVLERLYGPLFLSQSMPPQTGLAYIDLATHTCALHVARAFGTRGRVIPAISACTSGSQSIGFAFDAIRYGLADVMIAGGADELHRATAVTFDLLMATSTHYNDRPDRTPRPFDAARDGLVIAEGAGTVVLEAVEHARARGAPILAEIAGFGTCCDGLHVTAPSEEGMRRAMEAALDDARVQPRHIDYVNGHGTGTDIGDVAESRATRALFQREVPFSATKSSTGHTLGACGAIEAVFCIEMMRLGFLAPNRNLDEIDPRCGALGYVREVVQSTPRLVMTNNFAFGGVNTSLVLRRPGDC